MTTLTFEPLISQALWLTLAGAGLALFAWYGLGRPTAISRRRWAGALTLMALGLTLVLLVLLSDGIHNAGGGAARVLEAARVARALACPVYTRTYGGDAAVKDLAVELRSPQELSFAGQKVPVDVLLRQRGLAGAKAKLIL